LVSLRKTPPFRNPKAFSGKEFRERVREQWSDVRGVAEMIELFERSRGQKP
jgi:hypothetical protein